MEERFKGGSTPIAIQSVVITASAAGYVSRKLIKERRAERRPHVQEEILPDTAYKQPVNIGGDS